MENRWGNNRNSDRLYFLGLQNHCRLWNYDCSHEIKRHLLLGRNVMTKLGQFSSVAQSYLTLQPHGLQHARPHWLSPTPGACSNSCPLSWWCYPTISSSAIPFSSCLQSFLASGSFLISSLHQVAKIGVSASTSLLPMNIQDWFPLGWTSWISLQSKGLSRVFSNTTVQKHQFFGTQKESFFIVQLSHPYMTPGKTIALTRWTFVGKVMSLLFNTLSRLVITFLPGRSVF